MLLLQHHRFPLEQEFSLELPLGYSPATPAQIPRIAVVLHAFHMDLLAEIHAYLRNIPFPADLFISTDTAEKRSTAIRRFADWSQGRVNVEVMPNRGRDVAPKVVGFAAVHTRYEYVLHLHTKRSIHDSKLMGWRGYLLETLVGSPAIVRGVVEAFAQAPSLGMLAPQHIEELRPWIRWGENYRNAERLAERMGMALPRTAPLDFPSGSMFWARSTALRPLLDLGLGFEDFPEECGQIDGTLAHAIERLYFLVCERAGFDWMKVTAQGQLHDQRDVVSVDGPEELKRFLARRSLRLTGIRQELRFIEDHPVNTSQPPKAKRVLHVLWRDLLGDGLIVADDHRIVVALSGGAASCTPLASSALVSASQSTGRISDYVSSALGIGANDGSGSVTAERNAALREGFRAGADFVLLIDAPGIMHPGMVAALLRMAQATDDVGLIEAAQPALLAPKPVDEDTFQVAWASGPGLAISRRAFEATNGFDDRLAGRFADLDLSWRARALGFAVLHCPRALFFASPQEAAEHAWPPPSGLMLARKWGNRAAEARYGQLVRNGATLPEMDLELVPIEWRQLAEFPEIGFPAVRADAAHDA